MHQLNQTDPHFFPDNWLCQYYLNQPSLLSLSIPPRQISYGIALFLQSKRPWIIPTGLN